MLIVQITEFIIALSQVVYRWWYVCRMLRQHEQIHLKLTVHQFIVNFTRITTRQQRQLLVGLDDSIVEESQDLLVERK